MTIPPVGSGAGSVTPQEDSTRVKIDKSLKESPCDVSKAEGKGGSGDVHLSESAIKVVDLQAKVTRAQTIERKALQMSKETRLAEETLSKLDNARNSGNTSAAKDAQQQAEEQVRKIDALHIEIKDAAAAQDENARVDLEQASKEVGNFEKQIKAKIRGEKTTIINNVPDRMDRVASEAKKLTERYQAEVRAVVEDTIRQSKTPAARDVADAERLLNDARSNQDAKSVQSANIDKISDRAIKLLE